MAKMTIIIDQNARSNEFRFFLLRISVILWIYDSLVMIHYENMPVTYDIDIKIDSEAVFIQKGYRVIKLLN